MRTFRRDGYRFNVMDGGPAEGEPIVLLHGWPGGATTWQGVAPTLWREGYRTLAPDQRGYSPGARPAGRRAYVMTELVADVVALLDAAGTGRAHVVGHDWGGAVAWALASAQSDRVASLTVLSTPHPRALLAALRCSDQGLRSSYVGFFQLPICPEQVLLTANAAVLRRVLRRSGLSEGWTDAYVTRQQQPGALTASLAWYRAIALSGMPPGDVPVPTRFVWSSGDAALGRRAAELTGDHVSGDYDFQVVDGAPHWLPEERPELVASAILRQVGAFPLEAARTPQGRR